MPQVDLVIAVADKTNADPNEDLKCIKRGHVINVEPDGHAWSAQELANPNYRIVSCNLPDTVLNALTGRQQGNIEKGPLRRRVQKIDLSKLSGPAAAIFSGKWNSRATIAPGQLVAAIILIS